MHRNTAGHCNKKEEQTYNAEARDADRNPKSDQECKMVRTDDRVTNTG